MQWHRTVTERAKALSVKSTALSKLSCAGACTPGLGCESSAVCWHAVATRGDKNGEEAAADATAGEADILCAGVALAAGGVQAAPVIWSGSIEEERLEEAVEGSEEEEGGWGGVMQPLGRWKSLMEHSRVSCHS